MITTGQRKGIKLIRRSAKDGDQYLIQRIATRSDYSQQLGNSALPGIKDVPMKIFHSGYASIETFILIKYKSFEPYINANKNDLKT